MEHIRTKQKLPERFTFAGKKCCPGFFPPAQEFIRRIAAAAFTRFLRI